MTAGQTPGGEAECPECKGAKGFAYTNHDQSCVFDEVCERHGAEWVTCRTCEGAGVVHPITLAIYKARGGPAPYPTQRGFA